MVFTLYNGLSTWGMKRGWGEADDMHLSAFIFKVVMIRLRKGLEVGREAARRV